MSDDTNINLRLTHCTCLFVFVYKCMYVHENVIFVFASLCMYEPTLQNLKPLNKEVLIGRYTIKTSMCGCVKHLLTPSYKCEQLRRFE